MPSPWDSISQTPWFQNMMRSRQSSMPGNMMSQLNRGGQQLGNMRPPPNQPAAGIDGLPSALNQPGTFGAEALGGAGTVAGWKPMGAPAAPSSQPSPIGGGLGTPAMQTGPVDQTPTLPGAGPQVGPPTQPGPEQAPPPQVGSTSNMQGLTGSLFSGGGPRPYKHGGAVEPTDGQKKVGNYKKRHVTVHGLDISIENEKGSTRSGKDKGGKPWSVKMPADYGYFRRSEGADGDHVDCYIGPHTKSPNIWVVDQIDADSKRWDEHKCFLGFASETQVRRVYAAAFSDGKGHRRIGSIRKMSVDEFKNWLKNGDTSKPVAKAA